MVKVKGRAFSSFTIDEVRIHRGFDELPKFPASKHDDLMDAMRRAVYSQLRLEENLFFFGYYPGEIDLIHRVRRKVKERWG